MKSPQLTLLVTANWGHGKIGKKEDENPLQLFMGSLVLPACLRITSCGYILHSELRETYPQIAESARSMVDVYSLKKREFLGTTSMDAELALISANMAEVHRSLRPSPFFFVNFIRFVLVLSCSIHL